MGPLPEPLLVVPVVVSQIGQAYQSFNPIGGAVDKDPESCQSGYDALDLVAFIVFRGDVFPGAQAIGALAFGTETVPRVDKIVGPGGLFVTLAKRQVFAASSKRNGLVK